MDKAGVGALHFVGAHSRADAAAAHRHTAVHLSRAHCLGQRDDEVWIVIVGIQTVRTEINDLMSCRTNPGDEFLLQPKPAVVSGNRNAHRNFLPYSVAAAARSASTGSFGTRDAVCPSGPSPR